MAISEQNFNRVLHAIADPTRRRILQTLKQRGECSIGKDVGLCASDIEQRIPLSQPTISHHMSILKKAGLVEAQKLGQWMWYRRNEAVLRQFTKTLPHVITVALSLAAMPATAAWLFRSKRRACEIESATSNGFTRKGTCFSCKKLRVSASAGAGEGKQQVLLNTRECFLASHDHIDTALHPPGILPFMMSGIERFRSATAS